MASSARCWRKWLAERTGRMQLPYVVHPNTGKEIYEGDAILAYLEKTYAS
jgi:hypothetical protein